MAKPKIDKGNGEFRGLKDVGCTIKVLPTKNLTKAAERAFQIFPGNRPNLKGLSRFLSPEAYCEILKPEAVALLTTKYWGTGGVKLGVAFVETTVSDLQNLILEHMNAWNTVAKANVSFALASKGNAEVRISRGPGGYWSYLGTDILHIPSGQQTMNLEGFVLKTPLSEYKRVVRHETGHTLGLPHEHMRQAIVSLLDPQKTIDYFGSTQGWSPDEVQEQVLTPLSEASLLGTPPDVTSIMCYQLPGQITKNGQPIPGGVDIDASDAAFAAKIYPLETTPQPPNPPTPTGGNGGSQVGKVTVDPTAKTVTAPTGWTLQNV